MQPQVKILYNHAPITWSSTITCSCSCVRFQDGSLPRIAVGNYGPAAEASSSPTAATAGARSISAGLAYSSPPAALPHGARNSISATSPSLNPPSSGISNATAAAAHAIATAAAAAAARELEDRVAVAEGRAATAERAAVAAARAAETAGRRVAGLDAELARATADIGDARGRFEAVVNMNQQVTTHISASSKAMDCSRAINTCSAASCVLHHRTASIIFPEFRTHGACCCKFCEVFLLTDKATCTLPVFLMPVRTYACCPICSSSSRSPACQLRYISCRW